jgi:hypothetical protein
MHESCYGMQADLVVLSVNLLAFDQVEIKEVKVLMTILGGNIRCIASEQYFQNLNGRPCRMRYHSTVTLLARLRG